MTRFRLCSLGVAAIALLALVAPSQALAFEQRTGTNVVVSDPVSDDLFLFGTSIDVPATVDGDVFAFGQTISISGDVNGTVVASGQTVQITGSVADAVRAAGQDVEIGGSVAEDVMLAGATVRVTGDGSVGRDALVAGQTVSLEGPVGRNVLAGANSLTIASSVGGDVTAEVDKVTVTSSGSIDGDLDYTSRRQADVQGQVAGQTTRHEPIIRTTRRAPSPALGAFLAVLGWIRGLIGVLLLGIAVVFLGRGGAVIASDVLVARPWLSLGIGFALLFAVWPVAASVFFLGLLVGGWWIAFVLLAAVWLLALVGMIVGGLALGRTVLGWMHAKWHPVFAMGLGIIVIWVVGAVPFVGWLLGFAAVTIGTGATALALWGRTTRTQPPAEQVYAVPQPVQPYYAPPAPMPTAPGAAPVPTDSAPAPTMPAPAPAPPGEQPVPGQDPPMAP